MLNKIVTSVLKSKRTKKIEEQLKTVLLSKVPFLRDADESLISDMVAAIESVTYKEGETIISEGDRGDSFFLVVEGTVQVSSQGEFIAALGAGGCFGEGALIEDGIRGATVIASEQVTLFQLNRASYSELTEKHRIVRYRLRELHKNRESESIERTIEHDLLKNAPFLVGAGGDLINELARYLEPKQYAKGDVLIREGDEGTSFFLIESGILGVSKAGDQITELGLGACLGEGALFTNQPCSATVTALAETSCFVLKKTAFSRIISRYPVFGKKLRKIYTERI